MYLGASFCFMCGFGAGFSGGGGGQSTPVTGSVRVSSYSRVLVPERNFCPQTSRIPSNIRLLRSDVK